MGAIRAVARAEVRVGWRGFAVLALLLGLAGGFALAAIVLAERTGTAYARLVAATGLDDARIVVPGNRPEFNRAVAAAPGVRESWTAQSWVGQVEGPRVRYVDIGAGAGHPANLVEPVVVKGRAPADGAADELLVGEPLAQESGVDVGDRLTIHLLAPAEIARFGTGFGEPDGATVHLRVVGVGRMPAWGNGVSNTLASPAFAAANQADAGLATTYLRLAPGAAVSAAFDRAMKAYPPPKELAELGPPVLAFPSRDVDPATRAAERVLVVGLAVFAVVVAGAGILVTGQGLGRQFAGRRYAQRIEGELGMTAGQRVLARVLAALPAAAGAGLVAAALAVTAGILAPLGSQHRFEPAEGFRPLWTVAVLGGAGIAVLYLGLAAATAAFAGRQRTRTVRASARTTLPLPGRSPAIVVGLRLALRGVRARRGSALAATTLVGTVAIAGVVGAATFGASMRATVDDPGAYGHHADIALVDAKEPDIVRLVRDDRVAALDVVGSGRVTAGGAPVPGYSFTHRKGALPVTVVSGRTPAGPGETALGPRVAERLGAGPGDEVDVSGARLRVSGIVVLQQESRGPLGDVVLLTPDRLRDLSGSQVLFAAYLSAAPGQAGPLYAELAQRLEVFTGERPDEIRNLGDLVGLPELLAVVLAVLAGAWLAHTLLTAGRQLDREVAVLSVLGATPGQVRGTLGVLAVTTVLPALLLGVPLGLALARLLWWRVATSSGVGGAVTLPAGVLALIAPAVLAGALVAAVLPALRDRAPATALRTE